MDGELVKALRNNADHYGFVGENGLVHLLTNAADVIEKLSRCKEDCDACGAKTKIVIESLQKKIPRWIHVTERLPEKTNHYLVRIECKCDGELMSKWTQVAWFCKKFYWEHSHGTEFFEETVTHWMPLPQLSGATDINVGSKTCVDCQRNCQMIGLNMPVRTAYEPPKEEQT